MARSFSGRGFCVCSHSHAANRAEHSELRWESNTHGDTSTRDLTDGQTHVVSCRRPTSPLQTPSWTFVSPLSVTFKLCRVTMATDLSAPQSFTLPLIQIASVCLSEDNEGLGQTSRVAVGSSCEGLSDSLVRRNISAPLP